METIYKDGYSKERLEREDEERKIGHDALMKKYNRMLVEDKRLRKWVGWSFVFWASSWIVAFGYKVDENVLFIGLAAMQFVLSCWLMWRIHEQLDGLEDKYGY